jgi:hypothetical protein
MTIFEVNVVNLFACFLWRFKINAATDMRVLSDSPIDQTVDLSHIAGPHPIGCA